MRVKYQAAGLAMGMLFAVAVPAAAQSLIHQLKVPDKYGWGCEVPVACTSPAEKYANMFERAWWSCLAKKGRNIDYRFSTADRAASGTAASVDGWADGCKAAEEHVRLMIAKFGRGEAAHFLKVYVTDVLEPPKAPAK